MGDYSVEYEDDRVRIVTVDNIHLAAWFDAPDIEHMRTIDRVYRGLKRRTRGGTVFVNVIVGGIPKFTQDVREEAARQTADVDELDLATCHLILVNGLAGTAVRMFMSSTMLVGRPPHPTKVFGKVEVAARWLTTQLGRNAAYPWDERRVIEVLERVAQPV